MNPYNFYTGFNNDLQFREAAMDEMNATSQNSRNEFNEFWDNFQFIPVKWIDGLTSKSRYLVGMGLFVYAILALLTFFPDNGW